MLIFIYKHDDIPSVGVNSSVVCSRIKNINFTEFVDYSCMLLYHIGDLFSNRVYSCLSIIRHLEGKGKVSSPFPLNGLDNMSYKFHVFWLR